MLAALVARGVRIEMLTGDREGLPLRLPPRLELRNWSAGVGPKEKASAMGRCARRATAY